MMSEKKKQKSFDIFRFLGFLFVVSLGFFIVLFFLSSDEKRTSVGASPDINEAIVCSSSGNADSFFHFEGEKNVEHTIKILFSNNEIDNISYTYSSSFDNNDLAKEAISWLHADYNKYMTSIGVYQENLLPTFSTIGQDAIINISMDNTTFSNRTGVLVFLDSNDYNVISNGKSAVESLYVSKGFACKNSS